MQFYFSDPLAKLAVVLVAGIVGGELVGRIKLPKVTGWIGTGILLRGLGLPGMDPQQVKAFSNDYMHFVLGFIAFTVGAALHVPSLKNAGKRIGFILLGEALLTPIVVFGALWICGMETKAAAILAAIAIAGASGTTVLVVQEARARGILTRTLVAAVALIDMVAVGVFVFVLAVLSKDSVDVSSGLIAVAKQFGITAAVGTCCCLTALGLTRTVVGPAFLGPTMVAVILGSWGAAECYNVSGILACTFAGIAVSNVRHDTVRSTEAYLRSIAGVLFAAFFTLAGMKLDFTKVPAALLMVVVFFLARLAGKYAGAFTAIQVANGPKLVRNYLGLALLPHGGVAVGLVLLVQQEFGDPNVSEISSTVTTVALSALAINQLLGPSATRFSLTQAGEAKKDRPRLLDFLDENHIMIDMPGTTKEQLIGSLADRLYSAVPAPQMPKDEFIAKVMAREQREPTALGQGLMIPHAIIEQGSEICGVLGINRKGLDFDAPDDRPIHAMLLLATPKGDSDRHLEVLAAFAKAITHDTNLCEQLYHARNAAHAYDILHADEAEDVNYFLDDAIEVAMERLGGSDDS